MRNNPISDRSRLVATAKAIAEELRQLESLSIHTPSKLEVVSTDTAGWAMEIGKLGKGQPGLEIWLDRFSGHADRKFYACFYSRKTEPIQALAGKMSDHCEITQLTDKDLVSGKVYVMKAKLTADRFNKPVEELYRKQRHHFFGFYDRTSTGGELINAGFRERAVGFFLDVIAAGTGADIDTESGKDFPRVERRLVKLHLTRERSGYLAAKCKERDGYRCQACGMSFEEVYGKELGASFAEAHHRTPLASLPDVTKTRVEELITVCANCHRILHRMDGEEEDLRKLQRIVRQNRKKPSGDR